MWNMHHQRADGSREDYCHYAKSEFVHHGPLMTGLFSRSLGAVLSSRFWPCHSIHSLSRHGTTGRAVFYRESAASSLACQRATIDLDRLKVPVAKSHSRLPRPRADRLRLLHSLGER